MAKRRFEVVSRDALISSDGLYRYWLSRFIKATDPDIVLDGRVVFIMLNPSVADAMIDDATIRRCMGFAYEWRRREIMVVNAFAWRSTDPKKLLAAADPVGPENRHWIREACKKGAVHVAAWGAVGKRLRGTVEETVKILEKGGYNLKCLGVTKDGQPRHPLMMKTKAALSDWRKAA